MQKLEQLKKLFKNPGLFDQALTHKSWVNENPQKRGSNERLEFLGDAVLELVVTDYLYKKFPEQPEGYLTALRANIVNTVNLAAFAKKINLGEKIYLSKGETFTNGTKNNSLLADTVEAVIGAIFLDQGMVASRKFIEENLLSDVDEKIKEPLKDPKSRLQETIQAKGLLPQKYNITKTTGPVHDREFEVEVVINGKVMGVGIGKTKQEAEQKAAAVALERLKV